MPDSALRYDEPALLGALSNLVPAARSVFAAACAERLIPVYRWFHDRTGRGDPDLLGDALERLWSQLEGSVSVDLKSQIEVAEGLVPFEDDSWVDECAYAQNTAAAAAYALRSYLSGDAQDAAWSARQVYEALDLWVATRDNVDFNAPGGERFIAEDPLVQAELARQRRCVESLADVSGDELRRLVSGIRREAASDGHAIFGVNLDSLP